MTETEALISGMPLPTLLSQALVAFTIEFDNEFEHRMPHRTTLGGGSREAPWLISLAMWANFLRCVGDEGATVGELEDRAAASVPLAGMERWGYALVQATAGGRKLRHHDQMVRLTEGGRRAREVCGPLLGVIEDRWRERCGHERIAALRAALRALTDQFDVRLPDYLPVLGYGLTARWAPRGTPPAGAEGDAPLTALLSRALLAFTLDYERESEVSLAIGANALRLLGTDAVRVRDLPRLAGVSKEGMTVALGFLERHGYATIEPDSASARTKGVRLMAAGLKEKETYRSLPGDIEIRWHARYGAAVVRNLREALEPLAGDPAAPSLSPLFRGLTPYPDGWRASVPGRETLPHYPMVLHRGGFPDGA